MRFSFVVSNRAGTPLGELREATGRRLRFPLNRIPTFTFTVGAENPMSRVLLDTDKTLIKGYEHLADGRRRLRFLGPVVTADKSRTDQGGTITFSAAGAAWRWGHRLFGKRPEGMTLGTALAPLDRGEMAWSLIDACNVGNGSTIFADVNDTGIRRGTIVPSSAAYIGPWSYKVLGEAITELGAPLDGYDWEVEPVEPTPDGVGLQIGRFNAAPAIGSMRLDVGWEFGDGKRNVASWTDKRDSGGLCNWGVNLPSATDDPTQIPVTSSDAPSIADRGLHEAVIAGDLVVSELRSKLVQEHVRVRRLPRRTIEFAPIAEDAPAGGESRRVPRLFDDFIVGDIMPFRATEQFPVVDPDSGVVVGHESVKTVDALFRCFVADVAIDEGGNSTPSLTLVEEG